MHIETVRIYENTEASDKLRILVDKLWPRGISKDEAHLDHWYKQWAPNDELRKQFHQDKISWEEFQKQYKKELKDNKDHILNDLESLDNRKSILLLYGSKNKSENHAILLKDFLENL
jgi:uncharacterized protein YeaO (DUF488 family)